MAQLCQELRGIKIGVLWTFLWSSTYALEMKKAIHESEEEAFRIKHTYIDGQIIVDTAYFILKKAFMCKIWFKKEVVNQYGFQNLKTQAVQVRK